MSELHGKLLLELLRSRLSANVRKDLAGETDESLALRKALLTLIMLTQDGAGLCLEMFEPPTWGFCSALFAHRRLLFHRGCPPYAYDRTA